MLCTAPEGQLEVHMEDFRAISVEVDERGVADLRLNNPERRNALSAQMMNELAAFARRVRDRRDIRVVVLSGAGGMFCAGGDLTWMKAQINANRETRMAEARRLAMMLKDLNEIPLPLIGRLEGAALGGGVGMACVCDIAIASRDCRIGLTETRLGLIPATIGPYVVARMGEARARRVVMSGSVFRGDEAAALGIVARAVEPEEMDAAIAGEVAPFLELPQGSPGRAKALVRSLGPQIDDAVIEASIQRLADTWETEEAREGIAAFLEKRKPRWAGTGGT